LASSPGTAARADGFFVVIYRDSLGGGGPTLMLKSAKLPIRQYLVLFARYLRPQWRKVVLLTVLLTASVGLQLVNPQILQQFIDAAQAGAASSVLIRLAVLFTVIALVNQGVSVLGTYFGQQVGWTATNDMRMDLARHCLNLDLSFHKEHSAGVMIERIDGDVNQLSNFFSQFLHLVISNLLLLLGVLAILYSIDWRLGLSITVFVVIGMLALDRIRRWAVPHWKQMREMSSEFFGFLGERLANTEDTRANGATEYVMQQLLGVLQRWLPVSKRAGMAGFSMWITTLLVFALGNVVVFGLGYHLWSRGLISIGTAYVIFYYTGMLSQPIETIRTQMEDLQRAEASILRVRELFDRQPSIQDGALIVLPPGALAVAFEGVSFAYDDGHRVLADVTFALGSGRVLGIIGRTGSGKTTMARLLARLLDPADGVIRLSQVDSRRLTLATLRSHIGFVTQEVQLFHATVRENITFFNPEIRDDAVLSVITRLGLSDWLAHLPDGLDTVLQGSGGLSAGESQLVAFARVFLSDPGLIVMDEASSRLDPATEQWMERAVSQLLAGRTGILIAHRLATLERADDILILEEGRIVEYGSRGELADDVTSRYHTLLHTGLTEVLA